MHFTTCTGDYAHQHILDNNDKILREALILGTTARFIGGTLALYISDGEIYLCVAQSI